MALKDEIKASLNNSNTSSTQTTRKSLLQELVDREGIAGTNKKYINYALNNGGGFGASFGGLQYDGNDAYMTHDFAAQIAMQRLIKEQEEQFKSQFANEDEYNYYMGMQNARSASQKRGETGEQWYNNASAAYEAASKELEAAKKKKDPNVNDIAKKAEELQKDLEYAGYFRYSDYGTDPEYQSNVDVGKNKYGILSGNPSPNYGKGNIDLNSRPKVQNPDGSYSTVDSTSFNINGKEVLIPTVINVNGTWKHVDEQTALEHYKQTGEYLGIFDTPEEANAYAEKLHTDQEKLYSGTTRANNFGAIPVEDYMADGTPEWLAKALHYLTFPGATEATTGAEAVTNFNASQRANFEADNSWREPSDNWTDDERNIYYYLLGRGDDTTDADKYAETINAKYNSETYNAQQEKVQQFAKDHPILGTAASVGSSLLSTGAFISASNEQAARGTVTQKGSMNIADYSPAIQSTIAQSLNDKSGEGIHSSNQTVENILEWTGLAGKKWGDAYQLGTSILQSWASIAAGGEVGSLGMFFGSAAYQTMKDAMSRGLDSSSAVTLGALSGLAEVAGEIFSVDNLINNVGAPTFKAGLKSILQQAGIEGSEEGFTTLLNRISDAMVNGDKSELNQKMNSLLAKGYSYNEANKAVVKEFVSGIVSDMIGGAISGGISAGGKIGGSLALNSVTTANPIRTAQALQYGQLAGQDVQQLQSKVENRLKEKGKISNYTADKLMALAQESIQKQDTTTIQNAVEKRLTELGETSNVKNLARAIAENVVQGTNEKNQSIIDGSKYGTRVSNELDTKKIKSGQYQDQNWVKNLRTKVTGGEYYRAAITQPMAKSGTVSTTGKTTANGKTIEGYKVTAVNDDGSYTFTDKSGKEYKQSEIKFGNNDEAVLYQVSSALGINNVETVNYITNAYKTTDLSLAQYAKGITSAYRYGSFGEGLWNDASSKDSIASMLPEAIRRTVFNSAVENSKKETQEAQAKIEENRGSERIKGAVQFHYPKKKKLSAKQKAGVDVAKFVSNITGKTVHIFESKKVGDTFYQLDASGNIELDKNGNKVKAPNGWFDKATGDIWLDINSGLDGQGIILNTLGHEIAHFIRQYAPNDFRQFAEFLTSQMSEVSVDGKSVSIESLVAQQIANANSKGREMTADEALEEVVASACDTFLNDGTVLQRIANAENNSELNNTYGKDFFRKLKNMIENFIKKIDSIINAYKGVESETAEGRIVSMLGDVRNKLQEMYADAFVNAARNSSTQLQVLEDANVEMDTETESVNPSDAAAFSERTWTESEYVQNREQAAKELAAALDISVEKAKAYIDSINSIAKAIADDRTRLDYFSAPGLSAFVSNAEYGGSFDFSTLCKKRRLMTGTFEAIQKALPNTALTADEILEIRNMMKAKGLEVSCGLCYVEGSRANMGKFTQEFIRLYKKYNPGKWYPNMFEMNTPDGIENVRINHPEVYAEYEYFWNHYGTLREGDPNLFASQQKPKLYQLRTEYKNEIIKNFKGDTAVETKNRNGGVRLQSFSDFEIVHAIDVMQIIMDMSKVGLAGQAYTKVPEFAWILGNTGLKINLSLIAKGVDANGSLIFDDVEGMKSETAFEIRNNFSKNVGTILVVFNEEQLYAAMADERIDFIIPFHRSQWKKGQYAAMGLPANTKDFTYMQNEKWTHPGEHFHMRNGKQVKTKVANYMPNEYWDFTKTGKQNAERYLEMCAEDGKRPKFYRLLENNGDGSYSLKEDGSTDGYWKLLIDFKMYDNDGVGSPQMPVRPEFNIGSESDPNSVLGILKNYQGGHEQFPVARGVVDEFVKGYKEKHQGVQYSDRYSYDKLIKKESVNAVKFDAQSVPKKGKTVNKAKMIEAGKRNASTLKNELGITQKYVYIPDIKENVLVSRDGISHGILGNITNSSTMSTAEVTFALPNILRNSIAVNELNPRSNEDGEYSYILVGYARRSDGNEYVVKTTINHFTDNRSAIDGIEIYDILKGIKAKKMKVGLMSSYTGNPAANVSNIPTFKLKITDFLDVVKDNYPNFLSDSVREHYGITEDKAEGLMYSDRYQKDAKNAIDHFGTTENFYEAGYILADGQMLDFSGRHWGLSDEQAKGRRDVDHEDIYEVLNRSGDNRPYFINEGNIRFSPEAPGINLSANIEPTADQYDRIREFLKQDDSGQFYVDFEGKKADRLQYSGKVNADKVIADMKHYYKTGEARQQSPLAAFYSERYNGYSTRELLANAMMDASLTDAEMDYVSRYQDNIEKLDAAEEKIQSIDYELENTEMTNDRRTELTNRKKILEDQIQRYDEKLLKLTAAAPLQNVLNRKVEKAIARQQEETQKRLNRQQEAYNESLERQAEKGREHLADVIAKEREKADRRLGRIVDTVRTNERERADARVERAVNKGKENVRNARAAERERANQRVEKAVQQGKNKVNEVRTTERQKAAEKVQKQKEHDIAVRERADQRRSDSKVRTKIKKLINDLNNRITKPSENHYVPVPLMKQTIDILEMIDLDTGRGQTIKDKIANLKVAYDALKANPTYAVAYDQMTSDMLQNLSQIIGDTPLKDMNASQLEAVYTTLKSLNHVITTAVKVKIGNEERNAFQVSLEMTKETRAVPKAHSNLLTKYLQAHLRADNMFARLGGHKKNSMWSKVARMLNDGQLKQTQISMDLSLPFAELLSNQKALGEYVSTKNMIDIGLKDAEGNPILVNHDIMVGIYMDLLNEDNTRHLIYGGKTIPDLQSFYGQKNDNGFGIGSRRAVGIAEQLSQLEHEMRVAKQSGDDALVDDIRDQIEDLRTAGQKYADDLRKTIEDNLTDYDREWIAATQDLMDNRSKTYLNETTLEVYGIEKAVVNNYFPITTDRNYINAPFETITKDMNLENSGFMKSRVPASNPTLAMGVFSVVNSQIDRVSQYCGLMPAIRNFNKIYNKTQSGYSDSLKNAITDKFGKDGNKWIENLISDLTGSRSSGTNAIDSLLSFLRGNLAQSTLTLNLRVSLAQAASYPSAAAEIGWKPLVKALLKGGKDGRLVSRADTELIKQYSPLLWYRMKGFSTIEIGDIRKSQKMTTKVWNKLRWLTGWIQAVDGATVGRLWYAAEYYVQDNFTDLQHGSNEYYSKVAEVFNDVVEKTQPNYTTMQRAAILREPSTALKAFTMFYTQRLQNTNIMYDAAATYNKYRLDFANGANDVTAADLKEAKSNLINAVSSQIAAAATIVGFKLFADMLLHSMNAYRDDDDELTKESVTTTLINNFVDSVVSSFLFGSELYTIIKSLIGNERYYGISMSGISSITDLISDLIDWKGDWKNGDKAFTLAKSVCQFFGIPLNNAYKIVNGINLHIQDITSGTQIVDEEGNIRRTRGGGLGSFEAGTIRTKRQNASLLYKAFAEGDEEKLQIQMDTFDDADDAKKYMRDNYLKDEYIDGNIDEKSVSGMLVYLGYDKDYAEALPIYWKFKDSHADVGTSQDELGETLNEMVKNGQITSKEAQTIWTGASASWKKSYTDWKSGKK